MLFSEVWSDDKRVTVEVLTNNQIGMAFWKAVGFIDYSLTLATSFDPSRPRQKLKT
jgi:hypothetical protein